MPDLSGLNPLNPANSELARLGAGRIRDVAMAVITSFGLEHHLTGPHKFFFGTTAGRPAPGNAGRIYINTDISRVEYDNGAEWIALGAIGAGAQVAAFLIAGTAIIAGAGEGILVTLPALPAGAGQRVQLSGSLGGGMSYLNSLTPVNSTATLRWRRSPGGEIHRLRYPVEIRGPALLPVGIPGFFDPISISGNYTYSLTAEMTGAGTFVTDGSNPGIAYATAL